ncbi:SDR family oxidoreductase [Piscinibacter gummiphilus]|uniref:Short-chain dehydrogenase n=1 Tax=Piscinibacter gummiphilus TaxID=946333 RepID=A0A1W6LFF9_9BURK|nr:SDR family oxidoreductase [Piscinibacter gummiphilus]ARN22928.1 short-chain dehydrogenase [Piscinibacter gummiphilus]ATU67626.1 short-chain dehydrogenase [Piscinibacter gummiphilus]GLS96754.1 short-chain dehydrogenase/reductase [Piscinibacter gummiphilus]
MKIKDSVAFVTGANRGLGAAFAKALLAAGAKKVYAAARDPASVDIPGVQPVRLDVTRPGEVLAAARDFRDVTLVINNAGISNGGGLLNGQASLDAFRVEFEVNTFGLLAVSQAFAPHLAANGGGAIVNVLSALSWATLPGTGSYSATKAASWALTNGLRQDLKAQGTQVVALHVGFMDTDMTAKINAPKSRPEDVVAQVIAAVEAGESEVLADAISHQVKQGLSAGAYLAPATRG